MQVGGSEKAYLAAKPIFLSMGKSTVHCGGAGNGSVSFEHGDTTFSKFYNTLIQKF